MTAPPAQLQSPARAPTLDPSVEDLLELLASILRRKASREAP